MPPGVEQMVWMLDFTGYSERQKSEGGSKVSRKSMEVLQDHYPERLGAAYIINSPWWMSMMWTVLSVFMSASTKNKIHWIEGSSPGDFGVKLLGICWPEELESGTFHFNYFPIDLVARLWRYSRRRR